MGGQWGSFWVVMALVFGAVFLLAREFIVPLLDGSARSRHMVQKRVQELATRHAPEHASLLRDRYLLQLKPWERELEARPLMARIRELHEQAGLQKPGYRTLLDCAVLGVGAMVLAGIVTRGLWLVAPVGILATPLPWLRLHHLRQRRILRFEDQLPDVVDVMVRALRAGYPFSEALKTVATEMASPAREEFNLTFNDINYGGDVRGALMRLAQRVPSTTINALVTAVLVQRETGGNLAEVLQKISSVLRGRFKFQRRVRTLSAEGRITAWVLSLTPPGMFLLISAVNRNYIAMLVDSPYGPRLIAGALAMMLIGVLWIRSILKVEV